MCLWIQTTAMVAAQTPKDFLSGQNSSIKALSDVEFRIGDKNALQIKTQRLARVLKENGAIESIKDKEGWWESGDSAELIVKNQKQQLKIIGRRCTTVVIAHRLNTLSKCDFIYEIKDGEVISSGTYQDLCNPDHPLGISVKV